VQYALCESALPENMGADHFGEFYIAKAEQSVWFVAKNGTVVSLCDFLLNAEPVAPPRHGRDGKDAEPAPKGERGPAGIGRDGRDGEDSKIPGPPGRDGFSIVGPAGRDGRDAPSIDELLAASRHDMARLRAEYAEIKLMLQGFCDINKKAGDYITWLKERAARRAAVAEGK
jgi:hypothetical protein